jgi:tetratricopeptide (TPR) repeat protein
MANKYDVLQKNIDAFSQLITVQVNDLNNRIGDLNNRFSDLYQLNQILIGVMGLFLVIGGMFTFFKVHSDAKKEARRTVKKWLSDEEQRINNFKKFIDQAYAEVAKEKQTFFEIINASLAQVQFELEEKPKQSSSLEADFKKAASMIKESPTIAINLLNKIVAENKNKIGDAESSVVVKSLLMLGNHSEGLGKFSAAANYFKSISDIYHDIDEYAVLGLLNYGAILLKSGQLEDSIKIFDDLIARFEHLDSKSVRYSVARAMLNKAIAKINSGKVEQGALLCQQVQSEYADLQIDGIETFLCSVGFVKAGAFEIMGNKLDAIKTFQFILKEFESESSAEIKRMVDSSKKRIEILATEKGI